MTLLNQPTTLTDANFLYADTDSVATAYVNETLQALADGRIDPLIALDVETAPLPGLEGYPGTVVDPATGELLPATKRTYLTYTRQVWQRSFDPEALRDVGVTIPERLTGPRAAYEWQTFREQVEAVWATPEGRAALEQARWTEDRLAATAARCASEIEAWETALEVLGEYEEGTMPVLAEVVAHPFLAPWAPTLQRSRGRVPKSVWTALHRGRDRAIQQWDWLHHEVEPFVQTPLDTRLLVHVLRVATDGRIAGGGQNGNRADPVRPGLDPYTSTIFLVQWAVRERETGRIRNVVVNTHRVALDRLRPLFRARALFIGANITFDLKMLGRVLGMEATPHRVFCVRVADRILTLGMDVSHRLAALCERYLQRTLPKDVRTTFIGRRALDPTPEQIQYAALDTEVLLPIYDAQIALARQRGQEDTVRAFAQLAWITAKWELEGYRIDRAKWEATTQAVEAHRDQLAAQLEAMLVPYVTAASERIHHPTHSRRGAVAAEDDEEEDSAEVSDPRPHAVIKMTQTAVVASLASSLLGIPISSLEKTARAAAERQYRELHNGETHPFFALYAQWAKAAKQASTYGQRFLWYIHPLTDRIHPTFTIAGTDTGRYTATAPNVLNIPVAREPGDPDVRGAFLAPEGHYLLGADYEAMELRIAGDLSADPMVLRMVQSGADPHSFTAVNMFHLRRAAVDTPRKITTQYHRGAVSYDIDVWEVPQTWTDDQVASFALSPEAMAAVRAVKERYGKEITRSDAKSVTFLWLFQGTPFNLAQRTGLPLSVCEELFQRFAQVYAVMDTTMKTFASTLRVVVGPDGKRYAYSEAYGGLRRYIALPDEPQRSTYTSEAAYQAALSVYRRELRKIQRELCNVPMQGGNARITTDALNALTESGRRMGVYPWLSMYDEIIAVARADVPPAHTKALLEQAMLTAAERYMHVVPPGAEADVQKAGGYWVKS